MRSKLFVTLFITCLVTLSSVQVLGREYFSGFVNKKLKNLLQCNLAAYYNLRDNGPDPNAFLDFVGEPEQFYWFIEHYLSVPFSIPRNLKNNKSHSYWSCINRSWVSEFLRKYEEPDINELMKFLDKEQRVYFSYTFQNIEPVAKYTSFPIKEFHKYCVLPPLIETNIKQKDKGGNLSFQLNQAEYKIYLSSVGTPTSALKNLYLNMEDGERKNIVKTIVENEGSNNVFVNCPVYDLKLHYNKECGSQPNVLKCLDDYIKHLCERRIAHREKGTFCDDLLFLFDALKEPYVENFKKFLSRDDVHLVKPQSVWGIPLFTTYKPRDLKNPKNNVPLNVFKVLNSKNKLFLSFFDEIPKSPYYMEESQPLVKLSDFASSIFDKLHRFFYVFKKKGNQISPVSVKELSHNISDFSFKHDTSNIECKKVKKSLNLELEVEVAKGVAAEKICNLIEGFVLTKGKKDKTIRGEVDDVHKGFRIQCILIATHVEALNIVRQLLNMESMLSLTSPFFEYAIIEFLVSYFNKGSEKFLLYLFSIVSVLYINIYYYEQLYCHHREQFELLRSKMIHPNIADRILENIKTLIKNPRYMKMRTFYMKFDNEDMFDKRKVFEVLYSFDEFLSSSDAQQKAKMQDISDESVDLDTTNDGIGLRKEDALFESEQQGSMESIEDIDEGLEGVDPNQQKKTAEYLKMVPDEDKANLTDRNKELELDLYKYIGTLNETSAGVGTVSTHSPATAARMGLNAGGGRAVRPAAKGLHQRMGQMGKDLKRMKGKDTSKLRKGVDFYESSTSLNQISPGESATEGKGSSTNVSTEGTSPSET